MSDYQSAIRSLREETFKGPVFGPDVAFGPLDEERASSIDRQIVEVATGVASAMRDCLAVALPEVSSDEIIYQVKSIVPKTAAFVPTLTVGELDSKSGTKAITAASIAIACMYATDQLIDRGDIPMLLAVERTLSGSRRGSERGGVREGDDELVAGRHHVLNRMRNAVYDISSQDAPAVFDCFAQKVLVTEAWLQRRSHAYRALDEAGRKHFLSTRGVQLANAMTRNAGVQSVSSSLYAGYRRCGFELPPVREVHAHPAVRTLLRVSNTVARVADEYSDWWMDAGNDPRYGEFSINPFNQYDPSIVDQLCRNAAIAESSLMHHVHDAFRSFHDSDQSRRQCGSFITEIFFNQLETIIDEAFDASPETYGKYLTLVMRVCEISHVNMRGDIALGT